MANSRWYGHMRGQVKTVLNMSCFYARNANAVAIQAYPGYTGPNRTTSRSASNWFGEMWMAASLAPPG